VSNPPADFGTAADGPWESTRGAYSGVPEQSMQYHQRQLVDTSHPACSPRQLTTQLNINEPGQSTRRLGMNDPPTPVGGIGA
jgi:hypothetical protein